MSVKFKNRVKESKTLRIISDENEVKFSSGDSENVLKGYASTFGGEPDSYGDVIKKGAFKRTLDNSNRGRRVKFLWQHNPDNVIGIPLKIEEDSKGLIFEAQFANTTLGNEARELAMMGAVDGLSIGFNTLKEEYDKETGIRTLTEIQLHEISLVTFEANTNAKVTDVKSQDAVIKTLVDAGYTRDSATLAARYLSPQESDPHKHSDNEPDTQADIDLSELTRSIGHSVEELKQLFKF